MDLTFDDICSDLRDDIRVAEATLKAIDRIKSAVSALERDGFTPLVTVEPNQIGVSFDPFSILAVKDDPDEDPKKSPSAANPEPIAPPPPPAPQPPTAGCKDVARPELKKTTSGPWSAEEEEKLIALAAAGKSAQDIAIALGRKVQSIGVKTRHMSDRIEERRLASTENLNGATKPASEQKPAGFILSPRDVAAMSFAEREINAHLNALGYVDEWSAAKDLTIAQALARGDGAHVAASLIKDSSQAVIDRWGNLNSKRGDIDHQRQLLRVLAIRCKAAGQEPVRP